MSYKLEGNKIVFHSESIDKKRFSRDDAFRFLQSKGLVQPHAVFEVLISYDMDLDAKRGLRPLIGGKLTVDSSGEKVGWTPKFGK